MGDEHGWCNFAKVVDVAHLFHHHQLYDGRNQTSWDIINKAFGDIYKELARDQRYFSWVVGIEWLIKGPIYTVLPYTILGDGMTIIGWFEQVLRWF